jgi:copper chaperone NosL
MTGLMRSLLKIILLLMLLFAAACSPKNQEPQLPEIHYGLDVCDSCGMTLDDPRFASATLLKNGEYHKFDDIGDMIVHHMDHPDQQVAAWFVHDRDSEEWLNAEDAFYVVSTEIQSPMGHGIFAFKDRAAAEKYAAGLSSAQVMNFEEVRADVHIKVHG